MYVDKLYLQTQLFKMEIFPERSFGPTKFGYLDLDPFERREILIETLV